jgi:hypothetical protein
VERVKGEEAVGKDVVQLFLRASIIQGKGGSENGN